MLVLDPITSIIRGAGTGQAMRLADFPKAYSDFVVSGRFVGASGPLWFAFALLAFSLVYALVRLTADALRGSAPRPQSPVIPSSAAIHRGAVVLIVVIALGTFLVRLVQPIGTSWLNMQLGFFTQYVVLFVVGLWAARAGLLQSLPRQAGKLWLRLAFAVGVPVWFLLAGLGGALSDGEAAYVGGWTWQAAGLAAWESFFCVAFSIGLITLYRERVNARTRVTGLLAGTSFGIYVFHAPLLVAVSVLSRTVTMYPLAKAVLAAAIAWAASLAVAWLVRRIPGVGKLFA